MIALNTGFNCCTICILSLVHSSKGVIESEGLQLYMTDDITTYWMIEDRSYAYVFTGAREAVPGAGVERGGCGSGHSRGFSLFKSRKGEREGAQN